jgi:hypothetical protein
LVKGGRGTNRREREEAKGGGREEIVRERGEREESEVEGDRGTDRGYRGGKGRGREEIGRERREREESEVDRDRGIDRGERGGRGRGKESRVR